ncbi:hypothetical protein CWS02_19665 [Enterobacter sp. EA-1]|nr:hypothetical protein CWS02_19665 [Enterobacter sp. EA-1]
MIGSLLSKGASTLTQGYLLKSDAKMIILSELLNLRDTLVAQVQGDQASASAGDQPGVFTAGRRAVGSS